MYSTVFSAKVGISSITPSVKGTTVEDVVSVGVYRNRVVPLPLPPTPLDVPLEVPLDDPPPAGPAGPVGPGTPEATCDNAILRICTPTRVIRNNPRKKSVG